MSPNQNPQICDFIPNLFSSFVDTFVDFSVSGGLFLPPNPPNPNNPRNPNPNPRNPNYPSPTMAIETRLPAQDRLIAVGDIHGDLEKCKQSLRLAGIIDVAGDWSGDTATVVQVGDVLDRGNDEIKILYYLEKLKRQAEKSGGKLITMNGNHEIMNIDGDFRYITKESLDEFRNWSYWFRVGISMKKSCEGLSCVENDPLFGVPREFRGVKKEFHDGIRARIAALRPKGPISTRFFGDNVTVLVVGENVFVHGGLLAKHVRYGLERINDEVREWIRGDRAELWRYIGSGRNSVVWLRKFSNEVAESCDCEALEHVLRTIPGTKRMIMGHTIQGEGINGACGDKAIRIDVGMSRGCGNGLPEVLEIEKGDGLRILSTNPMYDGKSGMRSRGRQGLGLVLEENGRKKVEVKA
ncbi:hypothetical protein vseg_012060 [Gypsophila vaccaria]